MSLPFVSLVNFTVISLFSLWLWLDHYFRCVVPDERRTACTSLPCTVHAGNSRFDKSNKKRIFLSVEWHICKLRKYLSLDWSYTFGIYSSRLNLKVIMFMKSLKLCWLYCIYRDNMEYHDHFLDDDRDMIFSISPNTSLASQYTNLVTFSSCISTQHTVFLTFYIVISNNIHKVMNLFCNRWVFLIW